MDLFPRMVDVQMVFGILIRCFVQCPLYILQCTPPYSTFRKSLISFDSSFHKVFRCLLGPGSFDSLEGPLAHKQASFPITFGGIGLISTSTSAPTTYLGSWAFVVSVKVTRFMVDQCPFLLARVCFPPFEQLIGKQMVQLQDSILECLHHHTFSSMFFDKTSEAHCAQILSCVGLGVGA